MKISACATSVSTMGSVLGLAMLGGRGRGAPDSLDSTLVDEAEAEAADVDAALPERLPNSPFPVGCDSITGIV